MKLLAKSARLVGLAVVESDVFFDRNPFPAI
jgi:hypothetical protein